MDINNPKQGDIFYEIMTPTTSIKNYIVGTLDDNDVKIIIYKWFYREKQQWCYRVKDIEDFKAYFEWKLFFIKEKS